MPVISIKSLPLSKITDIQSILKNLNTEIAAIAGIKPEHVWSHWQFFDSNYYAVGENLSETIQKHTHSPIAEITGFEGKPENIIEEMLKASAKIISEGLGIDYANVFITYNEVKSGRVFDGGEIVKK